MPATEAMPASAPRRAAHIGAMKGWKVAASPDDVGLHDTAEDCDVLGVLGQRADGDAGVGDDDVGLGLEVVGVGGLLESEPT
jgi:hypothetical protein